MAIDIYYSKKHLSRSFAWHFSGLAIWLGIYFKIIFPLILNRHQNVGEITHLIISGILTLIFATTSVKIILILMGCVSEFKTAPKIAYSMNKDGIRAVRKGEYISWGEVQDASSMAKSDGLLLRTESKSSFCIDSWGINPDEMKKAKGYVFHSLPKEKTKRLTF